MKSRFLQRLSLLLLLVALLAAQWGWLAHEHQAHDRGQVCEECLVGASLGHGVVPTAHLLTPPAACTSTLPTAWAATVLPQPYRHILGQRGPPHLS